MENKKMNTSAPEMTGGAEKMAEAVLYKIPKKQIPVLLTTIAQVQDLIVPIKKAGQVNSRNSMGSTDLSLQLTLKWT